MKILLAAGACALAFACTTPAFAKQWVDYTPQKGYWQVTTVAVEPNKIDDYLTGLKATWVPGEEIAKKQGLIDDYEVMVKLDAMDGKGNVMMAVHHTSFASLDPNKARDQSMEKAMEAVVPKDKSDAAVAGYDKYRHFVGEDIWMPVTFTK
jgi:hypothetical protein